MSAVGRGGVQCGYFADKGGCSGAYVRTLRYKKIRKFMVCLHGEGRSGGSIFRDFCADVFYVRSLILFSRFTVLHKFLI